MMAVQGADLVTLLQEWHLQSCRVKTVQKTAWCLLCTTGVGYKSGIMGMRKIRSTGFGTAGITLPIFLYNSATNITVHIVRFFGAEQIIFSMKGVEDRA